MKISKIALPFVCAILSMPSVAQAKAGNIQAGTTPAAIPSYAVCDSPKVSTRTFEVREVTVSLPSGPNRVVTFGSCLVWTKVGMRTVSVSFAMLTRAGATLGIPAGQTFSNMSDSPVPHEGSPYILRPGAEIYLGEVPLNQVMPEVQVTINWVDANGRGAEQYWVPFTFAPKI